MENQAEYRSGAKQQRNLEVLKHRHYGRLLPEPSNIMIETCKEMEYCRKKIDYHRKMIEELTNRLGGREKQFEALALYRYSQEEIDEAKARASQIQKEVGNG